MIYKTTEKEREACKKWRTENPGRYKYLMYRGVAEHKKICFDFTYEEFMEYWGMDCHYCGEKIDTIGLDRIDVSDGYFKGNVVTACSTCNLMKKMLTEETFVSQCKKVVEHYENLKVKNINQASRKTTA